MAYNGVMETQTTTLTTDLHLLGTSTRYRKGERVRVTEATNLPAPRSRFDPSVFIQPLKDDGRAEIALSLEECGYHLRPIIRLSINGDPLGSGFQGSESQDGGVTWYYRGDIGARPRSYWRAYCRRHGKTLRECEG